LAILFLPVKPPDWHRVLLVKASTNHWFLAKTGPLRGEIQETIVMALNNPRSQKKINHSFS